MYYHINSRHTVHETIESETIVMNLVNGNYFSFEGLAAVIWQLILKNYSITGIIKLVSDHYKMPEGQIEEPLRTFIEQLEKNELIIKTDTDSKQPTPEDDGVTFILSNLDGTFVSPILSKYTDMQDILLLDPIHDVDIKGWPEPKQEE
jgi:hypothetical protein